jgi:adenosylcobinamide kinase/adenosylcobinamide-phosphate guanylyltransferase
MPNKITLITGGTGAGKTAHALKLAENFTRKIYIATAEIIDDEMKAKVDAHIKERDETYATIEEPVYLAKTLSECENADVIIIDCITFWINNLMFKNIDVENESDKLVNTLQKTDKSVIIVTNEVGLGIIPCDKTTRLYAKYLSVLNKKLAAIADEVYLLVSGIEIKIKG